VSLAPRIRPGTLDDAPGMARLINAVIAEGAPVLLTGAFSEEQERAYLAALPARAGVHVAEAPGGREMASAKGGAHAAPELVAAQVFVPFAASMPAHAHVAEMGTWVDAAWRRHGLGRALWERTSALARERGFTKVFTDVRADNGDSLAFHLALGFSVAGTARGQAVIDGRAYDVVFIERGL
jgi:L-amino acid N-acyltransferase YncA